MQQTARNETSAAADFERVYFDDGAVLDDDAVQACLHTDVELNPGLMPIKGIITGALAGAAIWVALAAGLVLFWR